MISRPIPQYQLGDEVPYANGRLSLHVVANDSFILWPDAAKRTVATYRLATSPERAPLVRGAFEIWMTEIPEIGAHFFHAVRAQKPEELSRMKKLQSGYLLRRREGSGNPVLMGEIAVYSDNGCRLVLEHENMQNTKKYYEAACTQPVIS